jgi:hypothetical protein
MNKFKVKSFQAVFDNNVVDALIPELWAEEALMVLEDYALGPHVVYREFEDKIQNYGDVVNAHLPASFEMSRKGVDDDVVDQAVVMQNVPVKLNQHLYTSFIIKDGEESKAFKSLRTTHLIPALQSIANGMNQIVFGQVHNFYTNSIGKLGSDPDRTELTQIEEKMTTLKWPMFDRNVFLTPNTKQRLLDNDFMSAEKLGDGGLAVKTAEIGQMYGARYFGGINALPAITTATTTVAGAINNASGYAVGAKSFTVDGFSANISAGSFITIAGDMTPLEVAANVADPWTTITTETGLKHAVVDDAVVTVYTPTAINLGAGYAVDYQKALTVDTTTTAVSQGHMLKHTTSGDIYAAIGTPTATSILTDQPVMTAMSDDDQIAIGPIGQYNFAMHPYAIGLVTRPLAKPISQGALSEVVSYNNLSIRVTITYDGKAQGHRVVVDMLCGIKKLNDSLGFAFFA